jgi:DNA-directed RNA polymerase specialized sigma24 family protein
VEVDRNQLDPERLVLLARRSPPPPRVLGIRTQVVERDVGSDISILPRTHCCLRSRRRSVFGQAFWVQLVSVDLHDPSFRPPLTNLLAAQRLLEVAAAALDDEQLLALRYWLCGSTFEEIAAVMELPAAKYAERLVRAALERLRRRFGG